VSKSKTKELKELEDRLQEVIQERDEESRLRREILLRKYELKEEELEELRKQALPLLEKEEETVKELLLLVQGVRLKLEELQKVQVDIMSLREKCRYRIPASMSLGVKYTLHYFETYFPELLGLPPRKTSQERELAGAREYLEHMKKQLHATEKKNLESSHRFEREVEEARERVRSASERLEFLTQ